VLPLVVTVPSIELPTEPLAQWGPLTNVPAGHYTLRITSPQPAGGHLGVHLWSPVGEASIVDEMLVPQSRHLVEIDLPHDVPIVRFEVGNRLALPGTRIALIPGGDHRRD